MQTALAQGVLGPPGTSSSPVPGHSSPHPASSVVNTRPSSGVSMNGSPQSSSRLSPAQAQTAAISYANRGPADNKIDQFRVRLIFRIHKIHISLRLMILGPAVYSSEQDP
ncbi:hypothetical protein BS47DRAFT_1347328 [Hydnum rufescens UP504]|uniref:Uncharacterized protein n=1 Tax=Hydnum rufescens UP504 TaxID=1448309 RepID=A0A9P6DTQ9_9AGAM|nr:hypothetical protein BS47DRAFT_1347328 [Hydnum rufescens UP504]